MGGKVLRCAGAALLASLFLAATTARGQAAATDQIEGPDGSWQAAAPFDSAAAVIPVGDLEFAHSLLKKGCGLWDENPRAEALYPGVAFRGPEGPRFHRTLLSAIDARYISDSGDAELPSAPAPAPAPAPAVPASRSAPYTPITGRERVVWVVKGTFWPEHLIAGVITMGVATAENSPREDGPHWGGFGERYGVRLTSVAVNGTIEASLGSLWGEDPRYFRVPEETFGGRVKNVIKMTFLARRRDGDFAPAYARFIGVSGGNFLSNAWRPDSTADASDAVKRVFEGIAGHIASNAWSEFWPDAKKYIFHRGAQQP